MLESLFEALRSLIPAGIAAAVTLAVILGLHLLLGKWVRSRHLGQVRLAATLFLSMVGLLVISVFLPIDDTLRAQVIDEAEVAELRGAGANDLEADRVDLESRLQQTCVEVTEEAGKSEEPA